jgi:thiol-disulfide isomerase/thioredoxin
MAKIIMFYGAECPHCHVMMPLVERLVKEEKIKVEKREVWHNEKNADEMRKYQKLIMESSDGVFGTPAFIDEKGTKALCGEVPYAELKKWAKGK